MNKDDILHVIDGEDINSAAKSLWWRLFKLFQQQKEADNAAPEAETDDG